MERLALHFCRIDQRGTVWCFSVRKVGCMATKKGNELELDLDSMTCNTNLLI